MRKIKIKYSFDIKGKKIKKPFASVALGEKKTFISPTSSTLAALSVTLSKIKEKNKIKNIKEKKIVWFCFLFPPAAH